MEATNGKRHAPKGWVLATGQAGLSQIPRIEKEGEVISIVDVDSFLEREGVGRAAIFDGQPVTIAALIDDMCRLSGTRIDGTGSEEWRSPLEARRAIDLLETYAVGSVRTVPDFDFKFPEPFRAWDEILSEGGVLRAEGESGFLFANRTQVAQAGTFRNRLRNDRGPRPSGSTWRRQQSPEPTSSTRGEVC